MSGYTKLFGSILRSSVWLTPAHVRLVWITMLALADRDGVVESSVPGLAIAAGVERAQCEQALALFLAPDPDSRTPDHEGRRIEVVDGGWRLLNHGKYADKMSEEDRREKDAIRQRRCRERRAQREASRDSHAKSQEVTNVAPGHASHDTHTQTQIHTQTQTEDQPDPPALGRILGGFRKRHNAKTAQTGNPIPSNLLDRAREVAADFADRPGDIDASLDAYFASDDPFVRKTRWSFKLWSNDPGRWLPEPQTAAPQTRRYFDPRRDTPVTRDEERMLQAWIDSGSPMR